MVRFLLAAGVHPNVAMAEFTPFFVACYEGQRDCVSEFLRWEGVDLNAPDDGGASPFFAACAEGHFDIVERLLRVRGVDHAASNDVGATPIDAARAAGHGDVVYLLEDAAGRRECVVS